MNKKVKNYYEIMEVAYDVSKEDLKRAYHILAKTYHPDINPKTGNLFKEITVAYQTLSDPIKRRDYDLSQGIRSSTLYDNFNEQTKYNEDIDKDISNKINDVYEDLKKENISEDELSDIISKQLDITNDLILKFTKAFIKAKKEEEKYNNKQADYDMDFPFDWYEENQYYKNVDNEPIFKILEEFNNYKFESAIKSIFMRNILSILGVIFVYFFSLPLIIRNKIFKSYKPTNAMKNHKYKTKWFKYFVYLLYKNEFLQTSSFLLLLTTTLLTKILFVISYSLYWIFEKIIKYFIFPIAYAFRWIIIVAFLVWLCISIKR